MRFLRGVVTAVGALLVIGVAVTAAAPVANGTALSAGAGAPVIGRPVAVPARPVAGEQFSVAFSVRRAGTGAPLRAGTMVCSPSIAGHVIRHTESFRQGTARLAFLVPESGAGKLLTLKLSITAAGHTTRKVATFLVQPAPVPSLAIANASADEGDTGTTSLSFPVALSAASKRPVSVGFATTDGGAVAPSDYAAASGTLTFEPGQTSQIISITVVADVLVERDETFAITLSNPVHATISSVTATGTIVGDEIQFVSPAEGAAIPQNVATTACYANPTYGSGFVITFEWNVRARGGIQAVDLRVQRRGAAIPLVDARFYLDTTSYTYRSCGGFVADFNLTGWYWALRLVDDQGNGSAWAESSFGFAPCRLGDGTPCNAPAR